MSDNREMFDGILLGLAEKHPGGVPDLLKTIAEFLGRKTDFFTGAGEEVWKKMLLSIFEEAAKKAVQVHEEKLAKRAEAERKREEEKAKKAKLESDESGVTELTEEEAEKLQKELDEKKSAPIAMDPESPKKKKTAAVKPVAGEDLSKPIEATGDDEDDKEVGKLMPNNGNGANMEKYSWTQTLQEVETPSESKVIEEIENPEAVDNEELSDNESLDAEDANTTILTTVEYEIEEKIEKTPDNVEVKTVPNRLFVTRPEILVRFKEDQLRRFWPKIKIHLNRPKQKHIDIYPGCYQLPVLIEQIYCEMEKEHPVFCSLVSHSAFSYYCAVVVYNRILGLRLISKAPMTKDELSFMKQVDSLDLKIPLLLQFYIAGMGNVRIHNGYNREKYVFKTHPIKYVNSEDQSMGWFGRVGPETHYLYQKYPCLTVYAKRIIEESRFVAGDDANWNLPEDIAPQEPNAGFPSENMLGYVPLQELRASQKIFFKRCGITDGRFSTSNDTFCLSLQLLKEIRKEFIAEKKFKPCSAKIHRADGSVAQLPHHRIIFPLSDEKLYDSDAEVPVIETDGPFRQYSKYHLPNALHVAALRFQYQLKCHVNENHNIWSVYDFKHFTEVPQDWRDTMTSESNAKIDDVINYSTSDKDWHELVDFVFDLNGKNFTMK